MIPAIVISIGGFVIQMFVGILSFLNWNFPPQIVTSIAFALNILHIMAEFLPFIGTMVAIFLILIPAHVIRYIFGILLWVWSLVPWIGTKADYPTMAPLDLRSRHIDRNTLDLRNAKQGPRKKTMRDIQKP